MLECETQSPTPIGQKHCISTFITDEVQYNQIFVFWLKLDQYLISILLGTAPVMNLTASFKPEIPAEQFSNSTVKAGQQSLQTNVEMKGRVFFYVYNLAPTMIDLSKFKRIKGTQPWKKVLNCQWQCLKSLRMKWKSSLLMNKRTEALLNFPNKMNQTQLNFKLCAITEEE